MCRNLSSNSCVPLPILVATFFVTGAATCLLSVSSLSAHDEFKEVLAQRYRLRSVSCKACHTDNKDKKIRNAFGKLLYQELKAKKLTQRYKEAKEKGDEAEEKFEKTMVREFKAALKAVEKKPVTFLALLEAGLLNGTRLDKNQVDADALTIKPLSDAEVETIKVENAHLIEGEIKQMPPEEDRATPPKSDQGDAGSGPSKKTDSNDVPSEPDQKQQNDKAESPVKPADVPKPE